MKKIRGLPEPCLVRSVCDRAKRDEDKILQLWPKASVHKKEKVSELAFSAEWVRSLRGPLTTVLPDPGAALPNASEELQSGITQVRAAHQKVIKDTMPGHCGYKPSEFILANLHEAWCPYAHLLLRAARLVEGAEFEEIKPHLEKLGFEKAILDLFRPAQKRRYFVQQTEASIATMIVSRRHHRRIGSEEAVRTAQKRLYSRVRARLRLET
jgi:hypothetical protein